MTRIFTRPVPWADMHRQSFLQEDQCWTTCNGGFCCSNNHPDFQFQLLPTQGTTIIYLEEEYNWLSRHGKVPTAATFANVPNALTFDFGGPEPLSIIQLPCRLLGKCQGVIDKPLLCKIYPMFPVLGVDGELEDICASSIFELTMALKKIQTPCTVVDKRRLYLERWRSRPEILATLRHPYLILYLQAAKHFSKIYAEKLLANDKLMNLSGKDFWKTWELDYLLGDLMDASAFADKVLTTYKDLVAHYGLFLNPVGMAA